MVIMVKSSSRNQDRRDLIRNTWGSIHHLDGAELRTIFVVGTSDKKDEDFLNDEFEKHGDILQIDRPDNYR